MSFLLLGILNSQAAGGALPAHELIASSEDVNTSSFTFSNIPSGYHYYEIIMVHQSTNQSNGQLRFQWGGRSTNDYYTQVVRNASGLRYEFDPYVRVPRSQQGVTRARFYNLQNSNYPTTVMVQSGYAPTNTGNEAEFAAGIYNSSTSDNSITISFETARAGCDFYLYGVN